MTDPTYFQSIPLQMPHRMILVRLGHSQVRTQVSPAQRDALEATMNAGFALCEPQGCWRRLGIAEHRDEAVVLEDGITIDSASLARLLRDSVAVAIMATTMGPDIVEATSKAVSRGDGVTAVTYDAVGGQTADAAMNWVNDLIRQQISRQGEHLTKHRFSPGYGDLHLEVQRSIYRWLQLDHLGLSLTSSCMLTPEKSVTAIAGIERSKFNEEKEQDDS